MANALKLAITGLEHFHPQYGKLIGTGKKNGIQVFEQLNGNQRVLTSVKDGVSIKQVAQKTIAKDGYEVTTTEARNFVTGDRIKIERGINTFDKGSEKEHSEIYRNITRQDVTGNWDELNFKYYKYATDKAGDLKRTIANCETRYNSYDIQNGKFIEYDTNGQCYTWLKAGQRSNEMDAVWKSGSSDGSIEAAQKKVTYYETPNGYVRVGKGSPEPAKPADYDLPNGSKIPAGEVHEAYTLKNAAGRLQYYSRYSNAKMEQNLGDAVFNFFDRFVCKLKGAKVQEA